MPVVGAVLWQRKLDSVPGGTPIMPDGCLDLLWDGNRLLVAGPDTAARWHRSPAGTTYVALRFSGGLGPMLLGVPADELRDRTSNLEELWPGRQVRVLTEQVEVQPAAALEAWVVKRAARRDQDPLGPRVLAIGEGGDANRSDGRAPEHQPPPTTPTMPPGVRLWAKAPSSDNAVPAGARESPLRCAPGPSGSR